MASRFQNLSKPAISLLKSAVRTTGKPVSPTTIPRPPPTFSRLSPELACLQSLLPLHSAVSAARLTSCLAVDSTNSRALSQELGLCVPR